MLGNLLDNAIRYTQAGGRVTVRVGSVGEHVLLTVEDNGPGVPPTSASACSSAFIACSGPEHEGCGLGLAIVREIAQGHDADVRLTAGAHGVGTLVTITFARAA